MGANGQRITHYGHREVKVYTDDGIPANIQFEVCEVRRPILSVGNLSRAGIKVYFDANNPHLRWGYRRYSLICVNNLFYWPVKLHEESEIRKYGRNYLGKSERPFIQKMIQRAEDFYEKYGWTAVVLARFYPWIRTFMPPIAGLGKMNYYKFLSANIFGAILWGAGITTLGFYAASIPALDGSSKQIAGFFIVLTIAITLKNYIKAKRS